MATRRQRWTLVGLTAVVATTGAAGYGLGRHIQSPGDALNGARPPSLSVITAEVVEGRLESDLVISGTVDWSRTIAVAPQVGDDGAPQIVTKLNARVGDRLDAGDVIFEIDDRPLFVLGGEVPLLGDLRPGDSGPDVVRLQRGLKSAGYQVVADGSFGSSTMNALSALYREAGYEPPRLAPSEAATGDQTGERSATGAAQAEIALVPGVPVRILGMPPGLGQQVGEGALVAPGKPVVRADVDVTEAHGLREGQPVRIRIDGAGRNIKGRIAAVGTRKENEEGGFIVPVRFGLESEIPARQVGSAAEIAVAADEESLKGLLVPLAAIYNSSRDGVHVKVERDGKRVSVPVVVEETSDGLARVSPRDQGVLTPGDRVVLGVKR